MVDQILLNGTRIESNHKLVTNDIVFIALIIKKGSINFSEISSELLSCDIENQCIDIAGVE